MENIIKNLDTSLKTIKGYVSEVRALKKEVQFLEKSVKKLQSKKNRKKRVTIGEDGEKKKNGFARPTDISTDLADFLGVEHGIQVARTEVTKSINSFIKENGLQDQENRKRILLESEAGQKLKSLLTDIIDKDGNPCDLNFINIQKYIKHHFPKKVVVEDSLKEKTNIITDDTEDSNTVGEKNVVKKKVKKMIKKKAVDSTA